MAPKELVRERYPQADALYQKPVYTLGQKAPYQEGGWVVLSGHFLGASVLGSGSSEEEAWLEAVKQVRAQKSKPSANFKEWLAAQAETVAQDEMRRKDIEEWQDDVAELFAGMIRWLAEDDNTKILKVETGKTHKDEEGIGVYEIAAMRIHLGPKFVDLVPVGRNVVGGIGVRGDLGFRSEGRVDMRTQWQKYMMYRIRSEGGRAWLIVDDMDYKPRSLTRETFEIALQDLLS